MQGGSASASTSLPSRALSSAALTVSTSAFLLNSWVGFTPCCSGRGRVHCFSSCCMAAVPLPVLMSFSMRTNSGLRCLNTYTQSKGVLTCCMRMHCYSNCCMIHELIRETGPVVRPHLLKIRIVLQAFSLRCGGLAEAAKMTSNVEAQDVPRQCIKQPL